MIRPTAQAPQLAPTASVAQSDRFYRPELDLLRFFAFAAVFLHHGLPSLGVSHNAGLFAQLFRLEGVVRESGSFGVCLFFLLSAYLITELLERERLRTGTVHVRSFYTRRILRIWPLYFFFLFVGYAIGIFVHPWRIPPGRILAFLLLSGNWYIAAAGSGLNPTAPLWSISLEEQFYLAWPWVAKIGGRTAIRALSLLLIPVSWLTLYLLSRGHPHPERAIWVNSFVQFQFFAVGALLALALKGRTPQLGNGSRVGILLAGLCSCLAAQGAFGIRNIDPSPPASLIAGYALVAIGCALLFLGFLGLPQQWLPKPLIYLGKISYGLYVFHMLAIACSRKVVNVIGNIVWSGSANSTLGTAMRLFFMLVAALAMTILLAMASYRFLEQPFLKMKERFAFIKSRRA
jgi:peptidoglycan/LPS O-acetylase OafA/YrhL